MIALEVGKACKERYGHNEGTGGMERSMAALAGFSCIWMIKNIYY